MRVLVILILRMTMMLMKPKASTSSTISEEEDEYPFLWYFETGLKDNSNMYLLVFVDVAFCRVGSVPTCSRML
jgi:hypothetical protein